MKEHQVNQQSWDKIADEWSRRPRAIANWEACRDRKDGYLTEIERQYLGNISGKQICVLGSGDNLLVFRFARLGAKMTSVDISQGMLEIARRRAHEIELDIEFIQSDVIQLDQIASGEFDIVYTGGHVAIWVADLKKYFAEAARILKPNGLFMIKEYHPFRQLMQEIPDKLQVAHDYFATGPFAVTRSQDIPSYNYHWTVSDYVCALLDASCTLVALREVESAQHPTEIAPLEGLPMDLILIGEKQS